MKLYNVLIITAIIIIILILIIYKFFTLCGFINNLDVLTLTELNINSEIKMGDIIIYALKKLSFTGTFVSPFIYFTHCGIVVNFSFEADSKSKTNTMYVNETNPKGEKVQLSNNKIIIKK